MNLAFQIASGSKCHRAQFGSLIVAADGKRIVATGYNGKVAGSICDHLCFREGLPPNAPKPLCCMHSEINALLFSNPLDRQGGTIYVSGRPCQDCGLAIAQSGIRRLVYWDGETTHGHPGWSGEDYWSKYGIDIERIPYTHAAWEAQYGGG